MSQSIKGPVLVEERKTPFMGNLEPIVWIGDNIEVCRDVDNCKYYQVAYVEKVYIKYTTPSIDAGARVELVTLEDYLEAARDELLQVRISVALSNIVLYVNQPSAVPAYAMKNYIGYIDSTICAEPVWSGNVGACNLTETWYMGDAPPKIFAENKGSSAESTTITVFGFRYGLIELAEKPEMVKIKIYTRSFPSQA